MNQENSKFVKNPTSAENDEINENTVIVTEFENEEISVDNTKKAKLTIRLDKVHILDGHDPLPFQGKGNWTFRIYVRDSPTEDWTKVAELPEYELNGCDSASVNISYSRVTTEKFYWKLWAGEHDPWGWDYIAELWGSVYPQDDTDLDVEVTVGDVEFTYDEIVEPWGPDLTIESVTPTPSHPEPGEEVHFDIRVKNQGNEAAVWVLVHYRIDSNLVGSDWLGVLPAGETSLESFTYTFEEEGVYVFEARADPYDWIDEANETDPNSLPNTDRRPCSRFGKFRRSTGPRLGFG